MNKAKTISAEEFDRKFDGGEDIDEYLDFDNATHPNKTPPLTLDLLVEAKAAHDDFMRTGLHLTGDEVKGWMDKIIQGEKADMPECHR